MEPGQPDVEPQSVTNDNMYACTSCISDRSTKRLSGKGTELSPPPYSGSSGLPKEVCVGPRLMLTPLHR